MKRWTASRLAKSARAVLADPAVAVRAPASTRLNMAQRMTPLRPRRTPARARQPVTGYYSSDIFVIGSGRRCANLVAPLGRRDRKPADREGAMGAQGSDSSAPAR